MGISAQTKMFKHVLNIEFLNIKCDSGRSFKGPF